MGVSVMLSFTLKPDDIKILLRYIKHLINYLYSFCVCVFFFLHLTVILKHKYSYVKVRTSILHKYFIRINGI